MATIFAVAGDMNHSETFTLRLGGVGVAIDGAVTCVQANTSTSAVKTSAVCTPDADQATYPGRFVVSFGATELVEGTWTLEFEFDGRTFPGELQARPLLVVRADENAEA
jgi:hypothetical protein